MSEAKSQKKLKIIIYSLMEYDQAEYERYKDRFSFRFMKNKLDKNTAVFAYGCDVAVACPFDDVSAEAIDELIEAGVKLIAMRCAGHNNVDIEYARGKIPVVYVPDYSPYSIAEYSIALMLCAVRKVHKAYNHSREHNFSVSNMSGYEFFGKTVGIVGEGRIGICVINVCRAMGMKVLVNTPHPKLLDGVEYVSLDELYERSDVIQLHCSLTPQTHHMINDESISRMKDGVVIVNTARGGLIDTDALIRGLASRKIRAAALDVYEKEANTFTVDMTEDILEDNVMQVLLGFPNVIISPHMAYFTQESIDALCDTTISNIDDIFETGDCKNRLC